YTYALERIYFRLIPLRDSLLLLETIDVECERAEKHPNKTVPTLTCSHLYQMLLAIYDCLVYSPVLGKNTLYHPFYFYILIQSTLHYNRQSLPIATILLPYKHVDSFARSHKAQYWLGAFLHVKLFWVLQRVKMHCSLLSRE